MVDARDELELSPVAMGVRDLPQTRPAFSFGVAQCPQEATEFDALVQLADSRLYEAKGHK